MKTVAETPGRVETVSLSWAEAIARTSEDVCAKMPAAMHSRLERGTALVRDGRVWIEDDGHTCLVQSQDEGRWYVVNGACECADYPKAPEHVCKHRAARGIYLKALKLMWEGLPAPATVVSEETAPAPDPAETEVPLHVPAHYVQTIQGKPHILYKGLLALAHERGLMELKADFTYNDDTVSLAHASALFQDGRRFEESGDATPENAKRIQGHWRRLSLTRAKARALRDALNIGMAAVEELD